MSETTEEMRNMLHSWELKIAYQNMYDVIKQMSAMYPCTAQGI